MTVNRQSKGLKVTPEQFGNCRQALGLSKVRFGDLVGVGRVSVSHYERGCRHDNGQPVPIPRLVEMTCAALMLGVRDFQDLAPHQVIEDVVPDHDKRLRLNEISSKIVESERYKLIDNGVRLSEHCIGIKVITAVRHWNAIRRAAENHGYEVPQLYFADDGYGQFFAIVDLISSDMEFWLKMELG
ncbi:hypothetical protein [Methylobacterium sp. J-077]|uniref:hypothetical protein n=1 Tax=Methylobacterium sp. J-077 TaxID=2836656 RepID=UPI001FB971F7|nr:hypothetical protein [Methylobacterium sp. J-077]MCJ2125696.1 hypothetical protein [Methylobacterium sp. J-077]